jgi:signal transduction histidine kinase
VASAALRERRQHLSMTYRAGFDELTLKAVGFAVLGLTVFGSVMGLFFARMAWDVRRLERRAMRIVSGYRGPALKVDRNDEIGTLMHSVNQMQSELRARDSRLEIARQEQMHKEKMAAIGALASGIAHEINNPIAAITGVAEEISTTRSERSCPHHGAACRPDLILEHARRVATITRQISTFSSPASAQPELIDVNALLENVCAFIRYDRRYRRIELVTDLDRSLPATTAVADHLTQVMMNLLVNAGDACADVDRPAVVRVVSRHDAHGIDIRVIDNGCGMSAHALEHAFDEYFTTKEPGKGTGLGLAVCRRLLESAGARITLESVAGAGATASLRLPLSPEFEPASAPRDFTPARLGA